PHAVQLHRGEGPVLGQGSLGKASSAQKRSPPIAWGACCCKCALVGSRTPNLLIRSQVLYPIELRVQYRASKVAFGRPKAGANIIRPALTRLVILHSVRHVGVQVGDAALVAG